MNSSNGVKTFGIVAVILSFVAWGIIAWIYTNTFGFLVTDSHERWGQFGDFIGGLLNPTFGLLSFFALLYTLFYQSKELSLSTEALKEQGRELKVQAFESTLFSMLNMCRERIDKFEIGDESTVGSRAVKKMYENLKYAYSAELILNGEDEHLLLIEKSYNRYISQNDVYIGQYLRLLDSLLMFIENTELDEKEKYWLIVRAQMTHYELLLLFYHSWVSEDFTTLSVMNKYNFFEYLPKSLLLEPELHASKISNNS